MDTGKPPYSPPASSVDHDPTADGAVSAVFRLLLPHSFSDADTMGLYAAVNTLGRRTAAVQVRVNPLDSSSAAKDAIRVAVIVGPSTPVRRIEASSSSGEPLALSPVQEALVAVADAEGALHRADVAGRGAPGSVTCLLLVEATRLEVAAGRGVLGRIALETGAGMRVVPWELGAPSPRGQQPEEVVEVWQP
jgi:poly(rC)-binding protein 3/4